MRATDFQFYLFTMFDRHSFLTWGLIVGGVMGLVAACSTTISADDEAVKLAAQGYLDAMGNYRIADARPFATEETNLSTLDLIENLILPNTDTAYIHANTPAVVRIDSVAYESDTLAWVYFTKNTPIQVQQNSLELRRRDGKWLAHVVVEAPAWMLINDDTLQNQLKRMSESTEPLYAPVPDKEHPVTL